MGRTVCTNDNLANRYSKGLFTFVKDDWSNKTDFTETKSIGYIEDNGEISNWCCMRQNPTTKAIFIRKIYKRCSTSHLFSLIFTCVFNGTLQVTFYMLLWFIRCSISTTSLNSSVAIRIYLNVTCNRGKW